MSDEPTIRSTSSAVNGGASQGNEKRKPAGTTFTYKVQREIIFRYKRQRMPVRDIVRELNRRGTGKIEHDQVDDVIRQRVVDVEPPTGPATVIPFRRAA